MNKIDVSVVVPIYNAEKYIEKCVRSLFEQTLQKIEFLFVDDCSPDNSIKIINDILVEYPNRVPSAKIIRNTCNKGVSYTRQVGISNAVGEYIIHCDPDDWVEPCMYEQLYNEAKRTNADIVGCNYVREYSDRQVVCREDFSLDKQRILKSIMQGGDIKGFLWNRLVKSDCYKKNNISFNENLSLWEDMSVVIPLHLTSNVVSYVDIVLYHYRKTNVSSIGSTLNEKKVASAVSAVKIISDFMLKSGCASSYIKELHYMQINCKSPYILDENVYNPQLWFNTFPESHKYVREMDARFDLKLIYLCASLKVFFIPWLRIKLLSLIHRNKK